APERSGRVGGSWRNSRRRVLPSFVKRSLALAPRDVRALEVAREVWILGPQTIDLALARRRPLVGVALAAGADLPRLVERKVLAALHRLVGPVAREHAAHDRDLGPRGIALARALVRLAGRV